MSSRLSCVALGAASLSAAASPAFAHPGPHHDATLSESLAHIAASADHIAALAVAALCALGAIAARVSWSRSRLARAKATSRSPRS